ncbi:LacI family DNA-binding transcriptional regulator [Limosilactobacillus sp.]|uniref:LacI family DNA-binding transcriptional regulator n=1 Tax=Limosilactobacillus sp. TaxID=2773925 RepID=UPI00345EC480
MTTIYDIAKLVGCAPSTVSKYITKHGYVSQALGEKIAAAMRDLDYHYNGIARILSTNSSNRIGVMVPLPRPPLLSEPGECHHHGRNHRSGSHHPAHGLLARQGTPLSRRT